MRLLYIGVCRDKPGFVPASNERRLYSDQTAAWRWIDGRPSGAEDGAVYEVDLEEVVRISREPAPTMQARYEHAERRATKWLALRDQLEPIVKGESPCPTASVPERDFEMHEWPPAHCGVLLVHRRTGIAVVQTDGMRAIDNLRIAGERISKMLAELGYGDGSSGRQESFLLGRDGVWP